MSDEFARREAERSRIENIVRLGISYSTMLRVFKSGSKDEIVEEVLETYGKLGSVRQKKTYLRLHGTFCDWFTSTVRTAPRRLKNGKTRASGWASYGQAAKTLHVAMKVIVYYCGLPQSKAPRIIPWLYCAIDTKILRQLGRLYPEVVDTEATTVADIDDQDTYLRLQTAVLRHIKDEYNDEILPVQYDDIEHGQL